MPWAREGASVGRVALLVPETATRDAVMSLVERRGPRRRRGLGYELLAASALLEMGNIVFSAAANALAEGIGGRVFPSVPRFSSDPVREAWISGESGRCSSQAPAASSAAPSPSRSMTRCMTTSRDIYSANTAQTGDP